MTRLKKDKGSWVIPLAGVRFIPGGSFLQCSCITSISAISARRSGLMIRFKRRFFVTFSLALYCSDNRHRKTPSMTEPVRNKAKCAGDRALYRIWRLKSREKGHTLDPPPLLGPVHTSRVFGSQSLDPPPLLGPVPRCRCSVSHALSCRHSTPCDTQRPLDPSAWRRSAHSRKGNRSGD